jgi:hypothetical protein
LAPVEHSGHDKPTGEENKSHARTAKRNSRENLSRRRLGEGGRDLLLAAARKIDPKNIYTWNVKHFRDLAPDWEKRVRTPKQA